jgi:hypothetical protein
MIAKDPTMGPDGWSHTNIFLTDTTFLGVSNHRFDGGG